MDVKKLLPIGSIVLLKDGEKKLMVCGILQNSIDDDSQVYDYFGVLYPEGHMGERFQYLFNHADIEKVVYRGYEDEERNSFIDKLAEFYTDAK